MEALQSAARDLFGSEGPPLDLAGSTDEGVVRNIHSHFEIETTGEALEEFYSSYFTHLRRLMTPENPPGKVFAGVPQLLDTLARDKGFALGLLTGNIAEGGMHKVGVHSLGHHFPFGAWGGDHWDRNKLGPIALKRASRHHDYRFSPEETWIIGDTPKDIACARACGARVMAVATGRFSEADLRDADVVFSDLSDTKEVIRQFQTRG